MFTALQVLAALVVAITFSTTVGHALEFPGPLRFPKSNIEPFSHLLSRLHFGGISEPVGMLMLIALTALTPVGSAAFWLTLGALVSFVGVHVTLLARHASCKQFLARQNRTGRRFQTLLRCGQKSRARRG